MTNVLIVTLTVLAALGSGLGAGIFFAFSAFLMTALSRRRLSRRPSHRRLPRPARDTALNPGMTTSGGMPPTDVMVLIRIGLTRLDTDCAIACLGVRWLVYSSPSGAPRRKLSVW